MELTAGYKQTEVGVIPVDWRVVSFGDLFDFQNGVNAERSAYGSGIRFINVLEVITNAHLHVSQIPGRIRLPKNVIANFSVTYADLLFNRTSETQEEVALSSVYLGTEEVVFGGFVIRGRPRARDLDPIFSGYALRSPQVRSQIVKMGQGAVRANVGQKDLSKVVAPLPPLPEQCTIATALGDADALIASLDALIAKKRDLKQATMQQLLTAKTRLPGFAGDWAVKRLGELLDYEQPTKYLVNSTEYDDGFDIPVLTAGKTFILGKTNEDFGVFNDFPVIIFDDFTTAVQLVNFPFKAKSSAMKILKPRSPEIDITVIFELMKTIDFAMSDHKRYWISEYKDIELAVPSPNEQAAIAEILADMDADLTALEAKRDKARGLKQGMIQELLTGRIRLA